MRITEKKQLLRENFTRDWNISRLPLREIRNKQIVEAKGKKHNVDKGYEVPIWRLNEKNLNGRIYSKSLAEKVIRETQKTFVLRDHPEGSDEGKTDDIVAVAKNPHIRDSIFYVNAYFVDDKFQEKVEKILEHGIGLGVSSSAYGDVDKDGRVKEEDFTIDRFFDFVLSPSYEVYLKKENSVKENSNFKQDRNLRKNKYYGKNHIQEKLFPLDKEDFHFSDYIQEDYKRKRIKDLKRKFERGF